MSATPSPSSTSAKRKRSRSPSVPRELVDAGPFKKTRALENVADEFRRFLSFFPREWEDVPELVAERDKPYYGALVEAVASHAFTFKVYPSPVRVFAAFSYLGPEDVKGVILGQDPYHNGQANGLAFSVRKGTKPARSLVNIGHGLANNYNLVKPCRLTDLSPWARQGILLLNTCLTVWAGSARSHRKLGWIKFIRAVLSYLASTQENLVFFAWGNDAQKLVDSIGVDGHHVIRTSHPSPLSARRGFLRCKQFTEANSYWEDHGISPVDWLAADENLTE